MEILIIIGLILLNGIFSMSEMALVSSKKYKLENAKNKGDLGAHKALKLSENPTKFLSTVQIGITLIGILLGAYSGEKLANEAMDIINKIPFLQPYAPALSTALIVILVTYISIVLGELLPKRIGMQYPETIISVLSRPMDILSKITSPFVWLLSVSNNLILKLLGIKNVENSSASEEEIKSLIKESTESGEIQEIEQEIVVRVFEMGDIRVRSLFTHKSEMVYFNLEDDWDTIMKKIRKNKHSAYPVLRQDDMDEVLGIVILKNLFDEVNGNSKFNIENYITQPLFINENLFAYKALELFKAERIHYAIVIDEYGSTEGILTMDDLMDALFGDTSEIGQEEYTIVKRTEDSWLVDGQFSLIEFGKEFELNLSNALNEKYATVAGLIIHLLDKVPNVGEKVEFEGYTLEVVDKDGQRVDKVLVKRND